jgi:D-aminopeptidase
MKPRARDLGIPFEGTTGKHNNLTDVSNVTVGYATIIEGEAARTGVTMIHPRGDDFSPVFAGIHSFNGNGEMTGAAWVEESGQLEGPIGITNTHSVGIVRDTIIAWQVKHKKLYQEWCLPVVAETADAWLNDMNGFFVKEQHVIQALDSAKSGFIEEGNVGGGTGMICYEFKGGTGTSSRKLSKKHGGWSVGALAQCNFGRRSQLTIAGVPVGKHLQDNLTKHDGENAPAKDDGSLIVILATDAPLLPHHLKRLAKRATLGMARTGSLGGNGSGDIFLAFSTANPKAGFNDEKGFTELKALSNDYLDPIFYAAAYATEEAIINALVAAEDMKGHEISVSAMPHEKVVEIMEKYGRLGN